MCYLRNSQRNSPRNSWTNQTSRSSQRSRLTTRIVPRHLHVQPVQRHRDAPPPASIVNPTAPPSFKGMANRIPFTLAAPSSSPRFCGNSSARTWAVWLAWPAAAAIQWHSSKIKGTIDSNCKPGLAPAERRIGHYRRHFPRISRFPPSAAPPGRAGRRKGENANFWSARVLVVNPPLRWGKPSGGEKRKHSHRYGNRNVATLAFFSHAGHGSPVHPFRRRRPDMHFHHGGCESIGRRIGDDLPHLRRSSLRLGHRRDAKIAAPARFPATTKQTARRRQRPHAPV